MKNPKKISSLQVQTYNEIKKMILLRELQQGEKIYENDLATKLKISRTPIREALLVLKGVEKV